jgi:hypothetical protein
MSKMFVGELLELLLLVIRIFFLKKLGRLDLELTRNVHLKGFQHPHTFRQKSYFFTSALIGKINMENCHFENAEIQNNAR